MTGYLLAGRKGTKALSQQRSRAAEEWRRKLDKVAEAAVVAWADEFGLESTARIIAGIAEENPRSRSLQEWKILSLLRLVQESLRAPDRALGEIAREVAEAAVQPRAREIPVEKFASELETVSERSCVYGGFSRAQGYSRRLAKWQAV